ncbi:MAG TPA: hypothetical protein VMW87_10270 [Spirochaetia bacterium]|nr:hypothetical protein [Spirochaetia bacterium]
MSGSVPGDPPASSFHSRVQSLSNAAGGGTPAAADVAREARAVTLAVAGDLPSTLRSGETVTLRVVGKLAGDAWQVSLSGKLLSVSSEVRLTIGTVLRAAVERLPNNRILLRLIPNDSGARVARQLGVPESPVLQMAINALVQSRIAIVPEQVSAVLTTLQRLRRQDEGAARVVALLHDRGLHLTAAQIEELLQALAGISDGGQSGEFADRHPRDPKDPGADAGSGDVAGGNPRSNIEQDVMNAVGDAVRFFCMRTSEIGDHVLQLFNHLPAVHDRWLVIPFGYSVEASEEGAQAVRGSLRLRVAGTTGSEKVDRARLYVESDGESWLFAWPIRGAEKDQGAMEVFADGEFDRDRFDHLVHIVKGLGFAPPARIMPLAGTDGFTGGQEHIDIAFVDESR